MPDLSLKVPAIEKLIDYGASGVGAIAGAMLAPWKASREGKARMASARADAEVRLIEAESEAKSSLIIAKAQFEARNYLLLPDTDVQGALEFSRDDIAQSIEFQTRKRLTNVRSVLEDAADELGDKEVPNHEPDPDWTARFFDCVQDVSSEDMQKIWSKILAGEVESPGRTSLRTLDTLKNMTKTDAELFKGVCDFVIGAEWVFYGDGVKGIGPLTYGIVLHLQACGLISGEIDLETNFGWAQKKVIVLPYHSEALMITGSPEAENVLRIPEVLLTSVGRELFQIVEVRPQRRYLQALSKFLKSKKCGLYYLEGVVPLPDGRLRYANRMPIEPQTEQVDGGTP